MNAFYLLILLVCGLVSCRIKTRDEILQMEAQKVMGFDNTVRKSLSDVWINKDAFCQSATDVDCAEQLDKLQHELNRLTPIPVPQPDSALSISALEATSLYKQFVRDHAGEPILAIFQQLYPRILLNKYGVLSSKEYGLIAYYAKQMAESGALDFDTRTNALVVLKGHIPDEEFKKLLHSTVQAATAEAVRQQKEMDQIKKQIAANPGGFVAGDPTTYATSINRKILKEYEASTPAATRLRLRSL